MLVSQPGDPSHVDLVNGGDVRRSASRQDHVLRDLLAHDAHLLDAVADQWFRRRWRADFLRGGRGRGRCWRNALGRTLSWWCGGRSRFDEAKNIVLGYTAT